MKKITSIGVMSGSSVDGLDLAFCEFTENSNKWDYKILAAETVGFNSYWKNILQNTGSYTAGELLKLHNEFGIFIGESINTFIKSKNIKPDIISSHGHTVFHNPEKGYTFQLGNGQAIANVTGINTVSDFRTGDVLLGGEGAPLVPIGDEYLFSEYGACINIGGIANISFKKNGKRIAYDICPANQILNFLARKNGNEFDNNGETAKSGSLNKKLSDILEHDTFYSLKPPKSLSNEYVKSNFISIIEKFDAPLKDKLYTSTFHIAEKIAQSLNGINVTDVLLTGGGAKNSFLIELIREKTNSEIVIPGKTLIDYKEALIFAFMGILKIQNKINCLASVTGASKDSSSGTIFHPL